MAVVEIMKDHLRETDWVARYGGDEFAVILPGCPADKLLVVADKLMRALTKQTLVTEDGQDMPIRVSMGGAVFPDTVGRSAKAIDLLQAADLAERSAKKAGGSQFVLMQESKNGVG
jgi:diguanylate cyclase (GGDEF)-like protein